jgi:hypothetical protein
MVSPLHTFRRSARPALDRLLGRFGLRLIRLRSARLGLTPRDVPGLSEEHLGSCTVVTDRVRMLERLPKGGVAIELGVLAGDFSERILRIVRPERLELVDLFNAVDSPGRERFVPATHQAYVERRFAREIADGRVVIRRGLSWEILESFPDETFDLVYIDADHSYPAVRRDLLAALPKTKPSGHIALNDYTCFDHLAMAEVGTVAAVNEICHSHDLDVAFFALQPQMFCDVVLRRPRSGGDGTRG